MEEDNPLELTSVETVVDDFEEETEDSTGGARSLLIFYDCETTDLSIYNDHITEIAAKVVGIPLSSVSSPSFSSLVRTPRHIHAAVTRKTGIDAQLLLSERPFSVVYDEFLKWIKLTISEVSENTSACHYPVLVAHNGFNFDFPFLFAEIERRPNISISSLISLNIHFSDTLKHLRQKKKSGWGMLKGVALGLENLYKHFLPDQSFSAHRALPDVEALEELFTQPPLADCLPNLDTHSSKKRLKHWRSTKDLKARVTLLISQLGNPSITVLQAKRLDELGLDFSSLNQIRVEAINQEEFMEVIKSKGVGSKQLRVKLALLVPVTTK